MLFRYKGFDKTGNRVKGTLSAADMKEAAARLRAKGIYFDSLKPASARAFEPFRKRVMPMERLSSFSKELASYLRSGMTILTAIRLLENQYHDQKRYGQFLQALRQRIEEGSSLYQALHTQEIYRFPEFYMKSVDIAAQSGKMVEVLTSMAAFFSAQHKIRKQVKNAMIYPAVIFTVAIAMTGFLITFVVPKITAIFQDTGQELPPITRFVLEVNRFLHQYAYVLVVGLLLTVVAWKLLGRYSNTFRYIVDRMFLKLPFFGHLVQNHELSRFSYILSLMLQSGVAYAQAVHLSVASFGNRAIKRRFETAAQKVMEGNKLSRALQLTPGVGIKRNFMHALALGEESSEVAEVLENIARLYAEENDEKIKIALSLLEPLMMLVVGAIVGLIVASMLLPIFTMTKGLQ